MPMFIEIFLMLCIIAQPQVYAPQPPNEKILAESAKVGHKPTIFSLINDAVNCTTYEGLKSEPEFQQLEEYCERPLPGMPTADEFVSYETVLCMVLCDAAQRVCEVGHQEVTKDMQNFNGSFSCDTMIKGVAEAFGENKKPWVTLFKAKLGNISNCEQACVQNKFVNPVCVCIWKIISLTYKAQVSSSVSADISPENPQVNSKGHGKTNETMTSKDKPSEAKALNQSSAAGSDVSIQNSGSKNKEQVDHKMTPTNGSTGRKNVVLVEANGNSTQSGSANDVKNNVTEEVHTKNSNLQNDFNKQTLATVNKGHDDAKKQTHTADSNTQNDMNKQAHGTNSNAQNIMKKQEPAINSSNHLAEVTPPSASSVYAERTPEAGKHDSTGKSISSDSKSNTATQPENESPPSVYGSDLVTENKNDDNEDFVMATDVNTNNVQDTDEAGNSPSGDEDQEEDGKNSDRQEEGREKISQQIGTRQEEEETDNTAPFNQLGDAADSHFYAYFMTMVVICIIGYLVFHNKQKILALALEGRSRRGTRRRPSTSAYRKLDSNLEEAVTSTGSTSVTHVIY